MDKLYSKNGEKFLKIWARYILIQDYDIIKNDLEKLAKNGQIEAISMYYEFKIDNKDDEIAKEVEQIVDNMNADASLMQAYCKALKSYHANMYEINSLKSRAKMYYNATNLKESENIHRAVKNDYIYCDFMQIIKPAIEKFINSTYVKCSYNDHYQYNYDIDWVERYQYMQIIKRFELNEQDPLFEDTINQKRVEKRIAKDCASIFSRYKPNNGEYFILSKLIYEGKVKTHSLFWNIFAKKKLQEIANSIQADDIKLDKHLYTNEGNKYDELDIEIIDDDDADIVKID